MTTQMRSRRYAAAGLRGMFVGVAAAAAMVLVGCGNSTASGDGGGSTAATGSPAPSTATQSDASRSSSSTATPAPPTSAPEVTSAPVDVTDTAPVPGTGPQVPPAEEIAPLDVGGGDPPVADACALVPVPPSLGTGTDAPTAENRGSSDLSVSTCVWGSTATDSMLYLYVIRPGAVADPGAYFIPQEAPRSMAAPQPPGGRLWEAGFVGLGGTTVEGRTYAWSVGADQVMVTFLGEITPQRSADLAQVVLQVDAALG